MAGLIPMEESALSQELAKLYMALVGVGDCLGGRPTLFERLWGAACGSGLHRAMEPRGLQVKKRIW